MARIHLVADSACDLPPEVIAEHSISIVPLTIRFGADESSEITAKEFWAQCRQTSVLPETAAPAPGAFADVFRQAADGGADGVVCVNLSSRLSATIQSAQSAAKEVAGTIPVRVVDSLSVSLAQGLQILTGARVAEEGKGLDEVADAIEATVPRTRLFGVLDTLENLKRGGRIGGAQALLGSMLSIKPVIQVVDGVVEQESKQRTRGRSLRYLADKVAQAAKQGEIEQLAVINGDASDFEELLDLLGDVVPRDDMLIGWVGPVIGTHAGPGVVGCAWLTRG